MAMVPSKLWRLTLVGAALPSMAMSPLAAQAQPQSGNNRDVAGPGTAQAAAGAPVSIIADDEFEQALPSLDAAPLESIEQWQRARTGADRADPNSGAAANPAREDGDVIEALADAPVTDALLDAPLPPIEGFDAEPPPAPTDRADTDAAQRLRFTSRVAGLDDAGPVAEIQRRIRARFDDLSALDDAGGRADSRAGLGANIRADRQLLLDIMTSEGFYDARVDAAVEAPAATAQPVTVVLSVISGPRYRLGKVLLDAGAVVPFDLIARNFVPAPGDPIIADEIVAAEANIAVQLPQNGYPFAVVGQRDILLDEASATGDYRLPVDTGLRSYFGAVRSEGREAFDADHIAILRRFRTGELYDSRQVDDLRAALVATGLLSSVSVEPVASSVTAPDGTAYADLLVRQEAGPARTLAASAGYGTGQGVRAEVSWTHRNRFPPEGALALSAVAGTLEQAVGVNFNRSNAGRRDRNVELGLSGLRRDYDAFDALTGRLGGAISYVSTPSWQKKFTYSFGFELLASYESRYDAVRAARTQQLFYVAALPLQAGFDTSDDLLNPTRGWRVNLRLSPEAALGDGARIYLRSLAEGSFYYPVNDDLVLAARVRAGTIAGTSRDALAPSRRYYGGGGGSVRGFGYQQLGPRDPEGNPVGGRSLNEAAVEARYRFGNFGVVGFVDGGQVYRGALPKFSDWRFGVGVGGRFYTNFGPVRVDVATPIGRQPGEARFTFYVSLGQAF